MYVCRKGDAAAAEEAKARWSCTQLCPKVCSPALARMWLPIACCQGIFDFCATWRSHEKQHCCAGILLHVPMSSCLHAAAVHHLWRGICWQHLLTVSAPLCRFCRSRNPALPCSDQHGFVMCRANKTVATTAQPASVPSQQPAKAAKRQVRVLASSMLTMQVGSHGMPRHHDTSTCTLPTLSAAGYACKAQHQSCVVAQSQAGTQQKPLCRWAARQVRRCPQAGQALLQLSQALPQTAAASCQVLLPAACICCPTSRAAYCIHSTLGEL